MTQQRFVTALIILLLLGWSLQLEGGARMNTIVKIIDLIMNLVVILWSTMEIVGGGGAHWFGHSYFIEHV
jgi:hypothetical protein